MNRTILLVACVAGLLAPASRLEAQAPGATKEAVAVVAPAMPAGDPVPEQPQSDSGQQKEQGKEKKRSPWLLTPLVSSNPKMGTEAGALGAYLHYFDPESQVSMFGASYEYSTTESHFGCLFARTSFGADRHRLEGIIGTGYVRNTYDDYLGTGQTVETTDDLRIFAGRYLYRFKGNWFVGTQGVFGDYVISGVSETDQQMLDSVGMSGFNVGGLGLSIMHDSRDNQDMPVKGWYSNVLFVDNSRALGANEAYDSYRVDVRGFLQHGKGHVLAVRQYNQFSVGAPPSAEATVNLRGYKMEQYLGRYMSSLEIEERFRFSNRWGATIFTGVAWLYGGSAGETSSDGAYPLVGAGLTFVLKPEDHLLVALEYAYGNGDNQGVYLRFGYAW